MFDLARHIEILLLDNDCVIVPNFGGFMTHHVDACYQMDEQLFLPPSRTLGFNPQLKINDSLLAQSYVEAYDISYPEAVRRIEDDVREMRSALSNEGVFELTNIGVISVNDEGSYVFEPCSAGVLTPSLYALTSFSMPILEKNVVKAQQEAQQQEEIVSDVNAGLQPEMVANDTVIPLHPDTEEKLKPDTTEPVTAWETTASEVDGESFDGLEDEEISEKKVITISLNAIRNTAAAVVLILVAVVTTLHFGYKVDLGQQQASIDTSVLQKLMPQMKTTPIAVVTNGLDRSEAKSDVKVKSHVSDESVEKKETEEVSDKQSDGNWVIVLASHVSGENAELYIKQLKKDGIVSARKIRRGHKIVCGSFDTQQEAQSYIKVLRDKSSHCDDCWVTKIEE